MQPADPAPPADPGTPPPVLVSVPPTGGPPTAAPEEDRPFRSVRTGRSRATTAIAVVLGLAALHLARGLLIPMALAALFAFLLAPLAARLERLRLGRAVSAVLSVLLLVGAFGGIVWLTAAQALDLARRLPEYRQTMEEKVGNLRSGGIAAPLVEARRRLEEIAEGAPSDPATAPSVPGSARVPSSVPVRVVEERPTALETLEALFGPLLGPLGAALVVLLLTTFLIANRVDVRERLIRLGTRARIGVTAQALDEAGIRVSRFLAANVLVNGIYACAIGIGLHFVGVPGAAVWALLAGLLRFVPYFGTTIAAALPLAVSFAVFDGWGRTGAVLLVFVVTGVTVANAVEPFVYGKRAGLSPLAVVASTVAWTWLWGVPGLFLAVPLTLCLAVAGRHLPGLEALDIVLGDARALGPAERVYERLLVGDVRGARRVCEESEAEVGPETAIEDVLLAALRQASLDRRRGAIDSDLFDRVLGGVAQVADGLRPREAGAGGAPRALLVPAEDEGDAAACDLLARRLGALGVAADSVSAGAMSGEVADRVATDAPAVVVVVALPPLGLPRVRYLIKRILARSPGIPIVGAVLDPEAERRALASALAEAGAALAASTLVEAVEATRRSMADGAARAPREDGAREGPRREAS